MDNDVPSPDVLIRFIVIDHAVISPNPDLEGISPIFSGAIPNPDHELIIPVAFDYA